MGYPAHPFIIPPSYYITITLLIYFTLTDPSSSESDPEPDPVYDIQTLIDVPPVLLEAMKWKRAVPEIMIIYFTPKYANLGYLKGLTFANGLLHSNYLEFDRVLDEELDRGSYQTGCAYWLDLMRAHPNSKVRAAAALWVPILNDHLFSRNPGVEGWHTDRAYLNLLRIVARPVGIIKPTWSEETLWNRARKMAFEQYAKELIAKYASTSA